MPLIVFKVLTWATRDGDVELKPKALGLLQELQLWNKCAETKMKIKVAHYPRFHLTFAQRGNALPADRKWRERLYSRPPKHLQGWGNHQPIRCEDLLKATIIFSNFDLRQEAHFATHKWPLRDKAIAALKKYYAPKPPIDPAKKRGKRLAVLLAKQKNWQRKAKLAQTKLRKLKRSIDALQRSGLRQSFAALESLAAQFYDPH